MYAASPIPSGTTTACSLRTMTPTLTLTTVMQMLPLTAATSFEHRGPQCLLTLTRSTTPPPRLVPCACVRVSPVIFEPSMNIYKYICIYNSFYKILFLQTLLWESIILLRHPAPAKPTLFHYYCATIAQ